MGRDAISKKALFQPTLVFTLVDTSQFFHILVLSSTTFLWSCDFTAETSVCRGRNRSGKKWVGEETSEKKCPGQN
jgi:hypothetical protein